MSDPTAIAVEPTSSVTGSAFVPHVIAWNLTRRCNLACAHCYIAAGSWHDGADELDTEACLRIVAEIAEVNPNPMLILSGGEPLVRDDLEEIARAGTDAGATVVIGSNGTGLTDERIRSLVEAGVQGVAVSVDSLDATYHDRFRHGDGALEETCAAIERLRERRVDVVIQTTVTRGNRHELERLAVWANEHGAVAFNVYFVVSTGRADSMAGLSPEENEEVLAQLAALEREYRGRMLVRSKCQPQIMRHVYESDSTSTLLNYATRCPCGVQYCRITPEGHVTPCPYMPVVAGDLRAQSFGEIWRRSRVFQDLRRGELGGKCGRCGYREICGGCRARAFADSGEYMAADTSCVYEPDGHEAVVARGTGAAYGTSARPELEWTPEAEARVARIPSFVRGVVTARVEGFARDRGHERVTVELLDEVRSNMPIDFSNRKPFFARVRGGDA